MGVATKAPTFEDLEEQERRFLLYLAALLFRGPQAYRTYHLRVTGRGECPQVTLVHNEVIVEGGNWGHLPRAGAQETLAS